MRSRPANLRVRVVVALASAAQPGNTFAAMEEIAAVLATLDHRHFGAA